MLELINDRTRSISQDMHALNRSCCVEIVRSSLTRAQRSTPQKRRRAQRRRKSLRTQSRNRQPRLTKPTHVRNALGFTKNHHPVPSYISGPTLPSISTSPPSDSTAVPLTARGTTSATIHCSVTHSIRLTTDDNHDSCQPSPALALLKNLGHGDYAGVRLGEVQNLGPRPDSSRATHRQPGTDQRSWRLSARQPGLRKAVSFKPAGVRHSSIADSSSNLSHSGHRSYGAGQAATRRASPPPR